MEKKTYIKPDVRAYKVIPSMVICGSEFGSGGSGDPAVGRAPERDDFYEVDIPGIISQDLLWE